MNSTLRVWIWRLVFLKFLISFACITPILIPFPEQQMGGMRFDTIEKAFLSETAETRPYIAGPTAEITINPKTLIDKTKQDARPVRLATYLFLLWFTGVIVISLIILRQTISVLRKRKKYIPIESKAANQILRTLCEVFSIARPPRLVSYKSTLSPYLVGLFSPTIVLPAQNLSAFSEKDLRLVMAHELAHLKKGHLLWSSLPTFGFVFFFFHPLVWVAYRELQLSQELEADEFALSRSNDSSQA